MTSQANLRLDLSLSECGGMLWLAPEDFGGLSSASPSGPIAVLSAARWA